MCLLALIYEGKLKSRDLAYNGRETRDKRPLGRDSDRGWCHLHNTVKIFWSYYILDYIRYKHLNWYGHVQRMNEERLLKKIGMESPWKKKKRKTCKFMDTGTNDWIEREGN